MQIAIDFATVLALVFESDACVVFLKVRNGDIDDGVARRIETKNTTCRLTIKPLSLKHDVQLLIRDLALSVRPPIQKRTLENRVLFGTRVQSRSIKNSSLEVALVEGTLRFIKSPFALCKPINPLSAIVQIVVSMLPYFVFCFFVLV